MKKIVCILLLVCLCGCKSNDLPLPFTDPESELGIDLNVNVSTIDKYLNRDDAVYRDMRMLMDEANYEAIGGSNNVDGFIKGFEIVPYPYICNPDNLPEEVGAGYTGNALYTKKDDKYVANYEEALSIVESLFPRNKIIFLMCGGGGYSGMMKDLLVYLDYDENKIYNVGGYWYYEGENSIDITSNINGEVTYDYSLVDYHDIAFDDLHPTNGYVPKTIEEPIENGDVRSAKMIEINSYDEFSNLINNDSTCLIYVYLPGCSTCASFKPIVEELIEANDIIVYQLNYKVIKDTDSIIHQTIKYTPSMFIFENGKMLSYLNPVGDVDKEKYESTENLSKWIKEYIDIEVVKTNTRNNSDSCNSDTCKL